MAENTWVVSLYLQTIVIKRWTSLDPVDSALLIQPVISSFGRFLKCCVCVNEETESTTMSVSRELIVNAFDVLMHSAQQMYHQEHQPPDSSLQPITERN